MFVGKIINGSDLAKTLKPVSSAIQEVVLTISEDGWSIVACDTAMTTMFNWTFSKSNFSEYNFTEKTTANVNLAKFLSVIERFETLNIVVNQTNIILSDQAKTFIIPQIASQEEDTPRPNIEFTASFSVKTEDAISIMKDVEMLADLFEIEVKKDGVLISAKSDTEGSFSSKIDAEDIKTDERITSSFSSSLLKPILNRYFEKSKVELMKSGPMRVSVQQLGVSASLLIAPRIQED